MFWILFHLRFKESAIQTDRWFPSQLQGETRPTASSIFRHLPLNSGAMSRSCLTMKETFRPVLMSWWKQKRKEIPAAALETSTAPHSESGSRNVCLPYIIKCRSLMLILDVIRALQDNLQSKQHS